MKRNGILNRELSDVLARMGHGQYLFICDAGFPIPKNSKIIDLSIINGFPTLDFVLKIIDKEFISEKVIFAKEVITNNPTLHSSIKNIFPDATLEAVDHSKILDEFSEKAIAIIRTGEYSPWGNIVLVSGTDPFLWFEDPTRVVPDNYKKRFEQIKESGKQDLYGNKIEI